MRNNKTFKKTVRTAIALAAFAMVGTATPALVYAEETVAVVEEATGGEVVCGTEAVEEEKTPSNEETPSETPSKAPSNEETPVKRTSFWDDPSGSLYRAYLWQKNNLHNNATPMTSTKAPASVIYTHTEDTSASSTEEVTVQNDKAAEASLMSAYENQMDALIREVVASNAEAQQTGVKKTVYHDDITTLTLPVMKTLRACPNVVLDMTYTYNGVAYHSAIAGGDTVVYDETVPCYGPLWLFANYGVN